MNLKKCKERNFTRNETYGEKTERRKEKNIRGSKNTSRRENFICKKKEKVSKKDYTSSEEEEEEEISLDDSSDDATYWIPEVEPSAFEEVDRDPEPYDFVLVQFKAKNNVFYVGKVLKLE
ncbi:hypothetical protein FQA39_LY17152 [Lamprigera yunnana]|nr:hypothetical protein FQA39_LY17152 [Lamprigera yunnana]